MPKEASYCSAQKIRMLPIPNRQDTRAQFDLNDSEAEHKK